MFQGSNRPRRRNHSHVQLLHSRIGAAETSVPGERIWISQVNSVKQMCIPQMGYFQQLALENGFPALGCLFAFFQGQNLRLWSMFAVLHRKTRLFFLLFRSLPGSPAAVTAGKRVHTLGVSQKGHEKRGWEENAVQRLHNEWMVSDYWQQLILFCSRTAHLYMCIYINVYICINWLPY